ncbi:ArsR/SmtB family transcription factor [Oerskovia merdavium]|uniref:Helix-turn-helix transcriptional regulator n=1 Tax=Oerskovia merdavium TaxID=2762227 RepID=A0ABR8TVH3_9CELL|nr:helix-turn-helix transcriptional regulator [Oerskovia merdavium]MBD7979780.1 helix-turn-helix transcriptional regulator [Oerskovia merdavium]
MSRYAYVPDPENDAVQSVIDELTSPLTRAVLRQLTAHGGLMSGQLALATGAHQQSVLHVLGRLERHGLVRADQPRESRQGRRVRYSADVERVDRMLATLRRYLLAPEPVAAPRGPVQVPATA